MLRMIRMIILMLRMIILMGQDDGSWFMAHGSRLMAHGSWPRGPVRPWCPREHRGRTRADLALPRAPGPDRPALAMSHEP